MWSRNPWLWLLFATALVASLVGLWLAVTWRFEREPDRLWVPGHEARSRLRVRLATPVWPLLPGRLQGWLCDCPTCQRGQP